MRKENVFRLRRPLHDLVTGFCSQLAPTNSREGRTPQGDRTIKKLIVVVAQTVILAQMFGCMLITSPEGVQAQYGIWTSALELQRIPMRGAAWTAVLNGAQEDCSNPDVGNQDDDTNVYVLAAAIVYARTGEKVFRDKVIHACEQVEAKGNPGGYALAWARETGAYALAADLVGYRTSGFETWLRNMTETYEDLENRTLREIFETRPNNWGSHAFGSLCAIYRYLGDTTSLKEIRDYWMQGFEGPNPGFRYGDDLSWHAYPYDLRVINPKHATRNGLVLDGIIPDDMRRGGPLQDPPVHTGYPWDFLQGEIMAARILERAGMPIWEAGDRAIYRAAYRLQVALEQKYGGWAATGDDQWMLPFLDRAYQTHWSRAQTRLWYHGKNTGWGYVLIHEIAVDD